MSGKGKKAGRESKAKKTAQDVAPTNSVPTATAARSTSSFNAPTVQDILEDSLTKISLEYWAPGSQKKKEYSAAIIDQIYKDEIGVPNAPTSRLMLLELSFYLEKYVIDVLCSTRSTQLWISPI